MQYPLPSSAVSVWKAGDTLWIAFPSEKGGHSIPFPASLEGALALLRILSAREREELAGERHRFATEGTPTSAQALALIAKRQRDREARANAPAPAPRERKPAKRSTRDRTDNLASFLVDLGLV